MTDKLVAPEECPTLMWTWRYAPGKPDRRECPTCGAPGRPAVVDGRRSLNLAEHKRP